MSIVAFNLDETNNNHYITWVTLVTNQSISYFAQVATAQKTTGIEIFLS